MESKKPEQELIEARIKKLEKLKELGINPWPYSYKRTHTLKEIREKFSDVGEQPSEIEVRVAGRILSLRRFGKLIFLVLQDASDELQIVLSKKDLGDAFQISELLDVGDFIGVSGPVFKTKKGELSILAKTLTFLAKSIRPWPEKYHGIKDIELKYRRRYLDLVMDKESYKTFIKRTQILDAVREFMKSQGFVEVETPILEKTYGGANAKPFITHLNALDMDVYLRIALELPLKKLLIGRFEKVFQIGKVFRNESIDRTHNPEFTMIEAYWAYTDYNDMMSLVENLYYFVAKKVLGTSKITWEGKTVDLKPPWERLTMRDAFIKFMGKDVLAMSDEELFKLVEQQGLKYEGTLTRAEAIDLLLKEFVEPNLVGPVFLIDHPEETTPLCKQHRKEQGLIERAEPYIFGIEVANIYSELNDPFRQRYLFELQAKAREQGAEETHPYDEDFLEALEYAMPPASGMGIGIDRMVMILLGKSSVRDVLFFPFMK